MGTARVQEKVAFVAERATEGIPGGTAPTPSIVLGSLLHSSEKGLLLGLS